MTILPRSFYDRDPESVACDLLGMHLVRRTRFGVTRGRIVEVEAYLATGDTACHGHRGRTRRNATMFGRPGCLYVYSIHARYCLNAVTEGRGRPSAILIRAIEPLEGLALMRSRRGRQRELDLARGPARLCQAFQVDRRLDGWDLTRGRSIWIEAVAAAVPPAEILRSPRIGVTSAHAELLRYFLQGNAFVSGPKRLRGLRPLS